MGWYEWPDAIKEAIYETWMYQGEEDEGANGLETHWGGCEPDTLRQILREGQGKEKVFAIFAVGQLEELAVKPLLTPFLHSSERMERWASAIVLGQRKEKGVFATLQEMLLEGIFAYDALVDASVDQMVEKAIEQWRNERFAAAFEEIDRAPVVPWQDRVDRVVVEAWEAGRQRVAAYDWYLRHRKTIALLLGAWGNPDAVLALRRAFQVTWQIEQQPGPFSGRWGFLRDGLHSLQDSLAYALGQLGVWDAFVDAHLPMTRQRIALTYLIFGALRVQASEIFHPDLAPQALSFTDAEQVSRALEKYFGWSEEERENHLQRFERDCQERLMS